MKQRILVFPSGTEIGLEIYRSLRFSTHCEVWGASSVPDHGEVIFANHAATDLPFVGDPDFLPRFSALVERMNVDAVYPAHDDVLVALADAFEASAIRCRVLASPAATCRAARSKLRTYAALEGVVPTPRCYQDPETVPIDAFPVFVKPDIGQGSKGAAPADRETASFRMSRDPGLICTEYLPGREYTVDCFTDRHRDLRFARGRVRTRIKDGIAVGSEPADRDAFVSMASAINDALVMRGAWFFQLKERADGELVLLEVAPRVAGTMGVSRASGVNLPLLTVFDAAGLDVVIEPDADHVVVDRALDATYRRTRKYASVFMDLDDVILVGGSVNPEVIAFVVQCRNLGIPVHVLTRHAADPARTLEQLGLRGLFASVRWIRDGGPKSVHIDTPDAIFIDDSFRERVEVARVTGIAVYDTHAVETLLLPFPRNDQTVMPSSGDPTVG